MSRLGKKSRLAIVTWVVVYPIITALLVVLQPIIADWPTPMRTLLLSTIMVPILVFWALPLATSRFNAFLNPAPSRAREKSCRSSFLKGD